MEDNNLVFEEYIEMLRSYTVDNALVLTDNNGGGLTVFNSAEDVKEKVTPMDGNIKRFYKHDKENGDMVMYQVPNDLVPRVLYK